MSSGRDPFRSKMKTRHKSDSLSTKLESFFAFYNLHSIHKRLHTPIYGIYTTSEDDKNPARQIGMRNN